MNLEDCTVSDVEEKGLVSIIIPGYKDKYILETIQCVLQQTMNQFEIIVIDDGSPNNLKQLLADLIDAGQIRYIYQENQKMAAARNNGIKHARGEFIAFLDDDDLWEKDKLAKQVKLFENEDVGLVYTFAEGYMPDKSIAIPNFELAHRGLIFCEIFLQDFIPNSSVMVRKKCFKHVGVFNASPDYFGVDDCDMWTRITHKYNADVVTEKLTKIRLHDERFSSTSGVMGKNDLSVRKHLMETLNVPNFYKRKYFQRIYFNTAYSLRSTNKLESLQYYLKSFIAYPSVKTVLAMLKLPLN